MEAVKHTVQEDSSAREVRQILLSNVLYGLPVVDSGAVLKGFIDKSIQRFILKDLSVKNYYLSTLKINLNPIQPGLKIFNRLSRQDLR